MKKPPELEPIARAICAAQSYTFAGLVGEGTSKQTFAAKTGADKRALKVYRFGHTPERTQRELEAMQLCNHPNIGKVFDASAITVRGKSYLYTTEELLEGGTLNDRIIARDILDDEALRLAGALASALEHLSERHLVHRDIKPDNIMFREQGVPVIIDFGLVRNLRNVSLTQTWLQRGPGTPVFASPEQLNNNKAMIDWRSDQFSLGLTLSLAAFGLHPFDRGDDERTVDAMAKRESRSADFLRAAVGNWLPLQKMTEPWPVERFRKAADLVAQWSASSIG